MTSNKKSSPAPTLESSPEPIPVTARPEPEKTLLIWTAPSRLFKKRNREFYTTAGTLVFLVSLILLFAQEFLLTGVICAMFFLVYTLSSVEPELITHTFTNKGIRTAEKLYRWNQISRYWWEKKWNQDVLYIETPTQFPKKLILLLGDGKKKDIENIVNTYAIKEKPDPSWLDNAGKWLQEKVPFETS